MAYNRVGTPKFYIDAVLLARKLGYIDAENTQNKFYLNPQKYTPQIINQDIGYQWFGVVFSDRKFCNSLTHNFILGHDLNAAGLEVGYYCTDDDINDLTINYLLPNNQYWTAPDNNGFSKHEWDAVNSGEVYRFTCSLRYIGIADVGFPENHPVSFNIGDMSIGWSYSMPHSPDLELTQTFSNESLKTQTTKGGHTLTNTGWNQPPKWGNYPQWKRSPNIIAYPARRSWNLKFSYISDTDLMPQYYNELDVDNDNRGIFERVGEDFFSIKNDFLSKVMPSINLGLPFIFQPNQSVEEYAICRVNSDSVVLNQVANNVYDINLDIIEVW